MSDELGIVASFDSMCLSPEDRRNHQRLPISCRVLLTPVDEREALLVDQNISTIGLNLSQTGACIVHDFPLTNRQFVLSFRDPERGGFVVEVQAVWTRTQGNGHYVTGCRILRKLIAPPMPGN